MIATRERYGAMLDSAAAGGYALPAINVTSSDAFIAVAEGLSNAHADGIVQVTVGGAAYLAGDTAPAAAGARALAAIAREVAADTPTLIALHTDHAPPDQVEPFLEPLVEASERLVAAGEEPLFVSHMFDGSTLPLEDNLDRSAELLERLAAIGVVLELEVGVVGGEEDGVGSADTPSERLYTTPEDLRRVAEVLGTGERGRYLLAATFGNVHGRYAPGRVTLRPEILAEGQEVAGAVRAGARFDYVFHGSSGSTAEELSAAVGHGVVKVNLDTDAQYAFTRAVADHMFRHYDGVLQVDGDVGRKSDYDPRAWGRRGRDAMAARVAEAAEQLGAAGRSVAG